MKDKIMDFIQNKKKIVIIAAVVFGVLLIGGGGAIFIFSGSGDEYEEEIDISVPHFTIIPPPAAVPPEPSVFDE